MDLERALEIVVARTRHERFRRLVDREHPDYHPGYVDLVLGMAAEIPTPPSPSPSPAPNPHLARLLRVWGCDYREPLVGLDKEQACGCRDRRACFAGKGRVSTADCLACVSGAAPAPAPHMLTAW